MDPVNYVISLSWHSRAGRHIDRHWFGGVGLSPEAMREMVASHVLVPRDSGQVRNTSLYGWKHTPPRLGRYYPRGLLQDFPRTDLWPFRVLGVDERQVLADFNPPLAGVELQVDVELDGAAESAVDPGAAIAAWLANGPGMQAPLAAADTDFLAGTPFARADETPDERFYERERLVDHLDEVTRKEITASYRHLLQPGMKVLDLMASWNSHLPDGLPLVVTGLGMNESELGHNPRLVERVVQNLNERTVLPFADAGFDAALCALSIEYLIDPVAVVREVGRVLKPGAPFVVSFSDRWFPPKAIRLWSELHPFERIAFVADLLRRSGMFEGIATESQQGRPAPLGDWRPQRRPHADPLFIVTGNRV